MKSYKKELTFNVPKRRAFINITNEVEKALYESGIKEGLLLCNAMHITASVFINDDEAGLHRDFEKWLEKLAPEKPYSQYDLFLVDSDHLALVIADVSGKGVPAALFMMVTNILITDRTKMGGTPGEILTFVNHGICEHNEADMFVTAWLGIVELSTGKVIASNAGHDAPAIYQKDKGFKLINGRHGLSTIRLLII